MAKLLGAVDWVITPSIWWENAPLVIQEAFQQRRPVICSDIGGMAEAVTNGHDGLHFRTGDSADLARVMRRAMTESSLWEAFPPTSRGCRPWPTVLRITAASTPT